ncbi:TrmH family RNA methyltransferase, partial [Acinetobacter baumannii]
RTSDAFLIEAVCLCGYTPQPPHRDIHKTALGATETVDWLYFENTKEAVIELKLRGYKVYAVEQVENSISLAAFNIQPSDHIAIVMGNEVEGV